MSGISRMSTRHISIDLTGDPEYPSVSIASRNGDDEATLTLDGEEWIELTGLIVGLCAAARFWEGR